MFAAVWVCGFISAPFFFFWSGFRSGHHVRITPRSAWLCVRPAIYALDLDFCEARLSEVECVCLCVRAPLCLLSDVAAVFQSACVIMRPQGAENSDSLTWRGWERSEAEGDLILLCSRWAQEPDAFENLSLLSPSSTCTIIYVHLYNELDLESL